MIAPTLRKLSSSRLTTSEIADLLQKHIGPVPTEIRCREVLAELSRIKDQDKRIAAQVLLEMAEGGPCERLNQVIQFLKFK